MPSDAPQLLFCENDDVFVPVTATLEIVNVAVPVFVSVVG